MNVNFVQNNGLDFDSFFDFIGVDFFLYVFFYIMILFALFNIPTIYKILSRDRMSDIVDSFFNSLIYLAFACTPFCFVGFFMFWEQLKEEMERNN